MSADRQFAWLWAGVSAALVALAPLSDRLGAAVPACPFRAWLDLPCLTCGTTRAALALARLDLLEALGTNPLAALGWIALVVGGLGAGVLAIGGRDLPLQRWRPTSTHRWATAMLLVANWAYLVRAGI